VIRRLLEAGPVGEEELDMIKMFCYNSAAEFCNRPYWRQRLATEAASDIFRNENVDCNAESMEDNIIPNIVWQQLDCHPVEGKWNLDKIPKLNENPSKPLDSMRYIEDASYVLSPCQRTKLSRVIRIPSYIQST
jgi:hypothetical protein